MQSNSDFELKSNQQKKNINVLPYFFSFADHLKVECLSRTSNDELDFDIGFKSFFDKKTQKSRNMLQTYGTENGRDRYHINIWVRAVQTWIHLQLDRLNNLQRQISDIKFIPVFIICDVRFLNETEFIKNIGGKIVRINAPQRNHIRLLEESNSNQTTYSNICSHSSETSLDKYEFKYNINNDISSDVESLKQSQIHILNNLIDEQLTELNKES